MKKRGFTIIELLGVIVILGLIAAFTIPALTNTLKESSEKEYNNYVKNITMAAENYFHSETDGKIDNKIFINVGTLVETGYLKKEINPKTKEQTLDTYTVIISKNANGTEKYDFVEFDATENGYINDGLLLYYDGYTNPTLKNGVMVWDDLSGNNNNGEIKNFVSSSILSNGISLQGNDFIVSPNPIKNVSTFSLEIVFKSVNPSNWSDVFSFYISGDAGSAAANRLEKGDGTKYFWFSGTADQVLPSGQQLNDFENNKVHYFSVTIGSQKSHVYNGFDSIYSQNSSGKLTGSDSIIIFNRYPEYRGNSLPYKGILYSVRVYNRDLSLSEIKNNYNIDKLRFDIED